MRWQTVKSSRFPCEALSKIIDAIRWSKIPHQTSYSYFDSLSELMTKPELCRKLIFLISEIDLEDIHKQEIAELTSKSLEIFASASGIYGGEFYTTPDLAKLLVLQRNVDDG